MVGVGRKRQAAASPPNAAPAKRPKKENKSKKMQQPETEDDEVSFKPSEPRRSPNGFILPDPLPPGHVLEDNKRQRWVLGKSIGLGGFGEIYAASAHGTGKEDHVVKVVRSSNERHFKRNFGRSCILETTGTMGSHWNIMMHGHGI